MSTWFWKEHSKAEIEEEFSVVNHIWAQFDIINLEESVNDKKDPLITFWKYGSIGPLNFISYISSPWINLSLNQIQPNILTKTYNKPKTHQAQVTLEPTFHFLLYLIHNHTHTPLVKPHLPESTGNKILPTKILPPPILPSLPRTTVHR